jgi:hypothetical protein
MAVDSNPMIVSLSWLQPMVITTTLPALGRERDPRFSSTALLEQIVSRAFYNEDALVDPRGHFTEETMLAASSTTLPVLW